MLYVNIAAPELNILHQSCLFLLISLSTSSAFLFYFTSLPSLGE